MLKIVKTLVPSLFVWFCTLSSISAQTFADLNLKQTLSPDSILFCSGKNIPIKIVVSLVDGELIDSFKVTSQLEGRQPVTEKVKRRLKFADTIHYELTTPLSTDSFFNGKGLLRVNIQLYEPNIEYNLANNSQTIPIRVGVPSAIPYTANFDGTTNSPTDWTGIKPDFYYTNIEGATIRSYVRGINDSYTNALSFKTNYALPGTLQVVKSPAFDLGNADLPSFHFNYAYGNNGKDTFSIDITKDCGVSYQTIFKKGGSDLNTLGAYSEPYSSSHWRQDSVKLTEFAGEKVQFRFTYKYKTNDILFIDDVQIKNRIALNKNIELVRQILPDNTPICPSDTKQLPVQIVIRNSGKITTDTILASFKVNNNSWITEKLVKKLALDDSMRYTFSQLMTVPDTGTVTLTLAVGQTNEQNTSNDTIKTTLNVRREWAIPFFENFEKALFPPKDWPTDDAYFSRYGTYLQSDVVDKNGKKTTAVYYNDSGSSFNTYLTTPPLNLKSTKDPYVAFDVAYNSSDVNSYLRVEISTDCGLTFQPIYFKRGDTLQTHDNSRISIPDAANQWRRDSVSLLPYKNKTVLLRFTGFNSNSGRYIFLDNIDVFNRNTPLKDASISRIVAPLSNALCPANMAMLPIQVQVANTGIDKIDTFIVSYKMGNTPSVSDTILKSLAFGESFIHTFKTLPPFPTSGTTNFFYTVKTVGDLDSRNDTLSNWVTFPTQFGLPFTEIFDNGFTLNDITLPNEWTTLNYSWIRRKVIGSNGSENIVVKYPLSSGSGTAWWLNTPYIDLKKAGKPYLSFDMAYARAYPNLVNRLKIEVSTDCGATFRPTKYDKKETELETFTSSDIYPEPTSASHWRRDSVDLSDFRDSIVIVRFIGYSFDGTPLYLDNIKIEAGFSKDASVMARIFPDTLPVCYPQRVVPVRVAVRNDGIVPMDTFKLSYRLNTEGVVTETFIKRLNFRDTAVFTFNKLLTVPTVGNHNLTFILNVNGDQNPVNDTLKTVFRLRPQYATNISETLENTVFPPQDWTIHRSDPYFSTWEAAKVIGINGDSTTAAYFVTQFGGQPRPKYSEDILTTYPVDLGNTPNPIALFDVAYLGHWNIVGGGTDTSRGTKIYFDDTLRVDISTDCGRTFKPTAYKKSNIELTTALHTYASFPDYGHRINSSTDWRRDTINLAAYKGQTIQLRFVHIVPENYATSPLYLDNFQFVNHEAKNLSLVQFLTPNDSTILCNEEAFPIKVKVLNEGKNAVDTFEIKYQLDNEAVVTEQVIAHINPTESKTYTFKNLLRGVKSGNHSLRTIVRLAGDTIYKGDTILRKITVKNTYNVPVIETFESPDWVFPPKDWQVQDRNYYFTKNWGLGFGTDTDGKETLTAMYRTSNTGIKEQDELMTWRVDLKNMKNPYLIFDIAAFRHYLQDFDTLRIDYSTDCGYTFKPTTYKKYDSQFITDPSPSLGSAKFPTRNQWRTDSVRLFNLKDSLVQFRFVATARPSYGMVVHLDNVRVVELPLTKTNDINDTPQYSRVFPNPTDGNLTIELSQNTTQQPIECYLKNMHGQVVKSEKLTYITQHNWQLKDLPAGIYFLFVGVNNQFDKHKVILIK